jgi:GNAT superfamily N-acetyltransferase
MTTIRTAHPDDLTAVQLLCERLGDFERPPGRTLREIADADLPMIRAQLESPRDDVLFVVAEDGSGTVIGTLFANTKPDYFTKELIAYVEVLAVAEAAAGRGLARQLMEEVERWARGLRMTRVDLTVFAVNQRARGFYEHLGYAAEFVRYVKAVGR